MDMDIALRTIYVHVLVWQQLSTFVISRQQHGSDAD